MPNCYVCKKPVTAGLVACQECAGAHAPHTRYARLTSCPAELAKFLRDVSSGKIQLCEVYCTSDCGLEDCTPEHELVCIEKWLMQTEEDCHGEDEQENE